MNVPFFRYELATGRILEAGTVSSSMSWGMLAADRGSGIRTILGQQADARTQYCVDEDLIEREPLACYWDGLTLKGLPGACTVVVDQAPIIANGDLTLSVPPKRRVYVDEPRYLRAEWVWYDGAMVDPIGIAHIVLAGDR